MPPKEVTRLSIATDASPTLAAPAAIAALLEVMPTTVQSDVQTYNNYIDGQWVPSRTGKLFENRNPANQDDLIGRFQESSVEDAEAAIRAQLQANRAQKTKY